MFKITIKLGIGCHYIDKEYLVEMGRKAGNVTQWLKKELIIKMDSSTAEMTFPEIKEKIISFINEDSEPKPELDWTKQLFILLSKKTKDIRKKDSEISKVRTIGYEISPEEQTFSAGRTYEIVILKKEIKSVSSNPRGGTIIENKELFSQAIIAFSDRQAANMRLGNQLAKSLQSFVFTGVISERERSLKSLVKKAAALIADEEIEDYYNPCVIAYIGM